MQTSLVLFFLFLKYTSIRFMKVIFQLLTFSLLTCKLFAATFAESSNNPWGADSELCQHHLDCVQKQTPFFAQGFSELQRSSIIKNQGDVGIGYIKQEKTEREKPKLTPGQRSCRAMIRFFQVYISPIDGPRSSFYPTSSQYTLEAIQKHGVLTGIAMGCDRLMRENGELWVYARTIKYGVERKLDPVREKK